MNPGRLYLIGTAAVTVAALAAGTVMREPGRSALWLALCAALAVQAPLGWWLTRAVGTGRFLPVWAIGLGARLALVALMALVVLPLLGWPPGPALVALVVVLFGFLLVECAVLALEHWHEDR